MSIAEIRCNFKGESVSSKTLDERIVNAQKKGVVHVGDPGKDLLARVEAFPHLVEYKPLTQTGNFPTEAHFVIAENLEALTEIRCRLDWESDGFIASEIRQAIIAVDRINNNPGLQVGNIRYEWTKTP